MSILLEQEVFNPRLSLLKDAISCLTMLSDRTLVDVVVTLLMKPLADEVSRAPGNNWLMPSTNLGLFIDPLRRI